MYFNFSESWEPRGMLPIWAGPIGTWTTVSATLAEPSVPSAAPLSLSYKRPLLIEPHWDEREQVFISLRESHKVNKCVYPLTKFSSRVQQLLLTLVIYGAVDESTRSLERKNFGCEASKLKHFHVRIDLNRFITSNKRFEKDGKGTPRVRRRRLQGDRGCRVLLFHGQNISVVVHILERKLRRFKFHCLH